MDRRFFIKVMGGALAAAPFVDLEDLPEWILDPPRGRSQIVVPRGVRLVIPRAPVSGMDFNGVRYLYETKGSILAPKERRGLIEREVVRFDRGVRQEKIGGVWRVKRD